MSNTDDERRRKEVELAREEQRKASGKGRESNEKGRWFHYGIAETRGEVPQNGWQHESRTKLQSGRTRIHDAARSVNDHEFREYKEGLRVSGEFVMEQISKEEELLRTDPKAEGAWIVREGAPDAAARRELERLEREFEGRFHLIEITQKQANRAIEVGRELERGRAQLELTDSQDLRKQQRVREQRDKIRQKQQVREAADRALEKQEQERKTREAQQQQRDAAERIAAMAREERESAQRGEKTPMTGREAADILAISRPTPGVESPHQQAPEVSRGGRDGPGRERDQGRER